jgi:hypothetical protein
MATIYNTTTKKTEGLELIDPKTGCDWIIDCIGNCDDGNTDREDVDFEMDQDTFDWWKNYVNKKQSADDQVFEYRNNLDFDAQVDFDEILEQKMSQINDMESGPSAQLNAIDEHKGAQ